MHRQSSDKSLIPKEEDKWNHFIQSPWLKQTSKIDKDLYVINNSSGQKIPIFKKHDPVSLNGKSALNVLR